MVVVEVALEVEVVVPLALASNVPPKTPTAMANANAVSERNFMVICRRFVGVSARMDVELWMERGMECDEKDEREKAGREFI